jgi:hypothetical protein
VQGGVIELLDDPDMQPGNYQQKEAYKSLFSFGFNTSNRNAHRID